MTQERRPWFAVDGQPGDRTLEQQLMGLDRLREVVHDRSVLDLGCAEGLISVWCSITGACRVVGTDVRAEMVTAADRQKTKARGAVKFLAHDLDADLPREISALDWDVVLALGVLHKLQDPEAALRRIAARCRELLVVRLPGGEGPLVVPRHGGHAVNAEEVLTRCRFRLDGVTLGYEDEWIGWFVR